MFPSPTRSGVSLRHCQARMTPRHRYSRARSRSMTSPTANGDLSEEFRRLLEKARLAKPRRYRVTGKGSSVKHERKRVELSQLAAQRNLDAEKRWRFRCRHDGHCGAQFAGLALLAATRRLTLPRKPPRSPSFLTCSRRRRMGARSEKAQDPKLRRREAEAIGTIGIIDSPAAAYTVARLASLREVSWEIVTRHDPTSKEPWRACLEDVYRDTGERKSRAVVFCQTKEQAQAAAVSLHNAKQKEIADFLQQARDAAQLPPPPARCTPLGRSDRKDVQAGVLEHSQKRWPRCFAILDGKRSATVGNGSRLARRCRRTDRANRPGRSRTESRARSCPRITESPQAGQGTRGRGGL